MKKILLTIFALLPLLAAVAQTDQTPAIRNFDPQWIVGVKYGFAQFHGDVSEKSFTEKLSKESKPSVGISLTRQITPFLSLNADLTQSSFYSRNRKIHWHDNIYFIDLAVAGNITMIGLSGTLNINKLISKESGNNWHAYVSGGFGFERWNCTLQDEYNKYLYLLSTKRDTSIIVARVKNSTYYDNTIKDTTKIGFSNKLYSSLAFGVHFQLTNRIGVKVEHAISYSASDLIDGYRNGLSDMISITTLGVTINLQNLPGHKEKLKTYPSSQTNNEISDKRSNRGIPKTKPEIQEYTGYIALLPPPEPKVDTTRKTKSGATNSGKNIRVAESDSGHFQITGSGKLKNEVYTSAEPQVSADLKTEVVPTYRIQILASKTNIQVDSLIKKSDLREKVSVELRSDGWYRYYVGQFDLLSDTRMKLAEMRAKGFKDSFIVSFKTNNRKAIK